MGTGPAEVRWLDDEDMEFGDLPDVTLKWNSTDSVLEFLPAVDDQGAINIGNGTLDIDFKVFLRTTADYVLFDVSESRVEMAQVPIKWTGTLNGKGLDFDDITLTAGSSNNILSFGDAVAEEVTITDYFFPIRLNLESIANPGAERLASLMFLRFAITTVDQANLDVQGIGLTVAAAFDVGYLHGYECALLLTDDLAVSMSIHAAKFGIDRTTAKTITGNIGESLSAVLAQISGNGINAGFGSDGGEQGAVLECKTLSQADVTSMIWLNLLNGTSAAHAIVVGNGGSGNITNLFWFANADQGNCVDLSAAVDTDDQESDGAIRILVGATEYFIPFFGAGKVTGSW
jgi:hypothetical protein